MKKAALYARVSSDMQRKEGTVASQIAELKRQIKASGDILVKEYVDEGYSGASLDRPGMIEMRKDLKKGLYDIIYVLNTDRLARDVMSLNIVITDILIYRKQIIINGRDYINNPENKFELTILGAVAELERAKIMERNMRGKIHRIKQGQLVGNGCYVFGYRYFPKTSASPPRLEINEEEAKIVRYIFETYAKGNVSAVDVARRLAESGVKDQRMKLSDARINYILSNETYAGIKYYNTMTYTTRNDATGAGRKISMPRDRSEWLGVPVPAIVSRELFDKARERLKHNRGCYRNALGTHLLSNLVFCGKCQRRCPSFRKFYSVKRLTKTVFYKRQYFLCRTHGHNHNPQIDARLLESCVREMVTDTLVNPSKLKEHLDQFKGKRNELELIEERLEEITRKLRDFEGQRFRIVDLYAKGGLDQEEYYKRMMSDRATVEELQREKKRLLHQIPLFKKPELLKQSIGVHCREVKKRLAACSDFATWRQFYLDYVKRIAYDKTHKTVLHISLHGSIPVSIQISGETENVSADFTITKTLSTSEALLRIRELDMQEGSMWGKSMLRSKYQKQTKQNV